MSDYYDILLLAIPVAMGIGVLASLHQAVALHQGIALGSLLSVLVLVEAIYRNPPVEPTSAEVAASVVVLLGWVVAGGLYLN